MECRLRLLCRIAVCALAIAALSACTISPPERVNPPQYTQYIVNTPTPEPSATDLVTPSPTLEADAPVTPEDPTALTAFAPKTTNDVEIFYPGMPSMMGFVDAPIMTIYENTMDAIAAIVSLRWPSATISTYRYNRDISKEDMLMPREQILASLVEPSFFRETAMNAQPLRVKPENGALRVRTGEGEKMNEPIASFYEGNDRLLPEILSPASGTVVALTASDPSALTIIVTDLHELRSDDGTLIAALSQKAFQTGQTIGILAVQSEFAGYVPDIGANKTSFVWGSPPSGTLDYILDFTDYKVGVSIDPQTRATKPRPFYVICLGEQSSVTETLSTLSDRLSREFANNPTFAQRMALYGSDYIPDGYSLQGHMTYQGGKGVTALADLSAPGGLSKVELKTTTSERYLEWIVDYPVNQSDPRAGKFTARDFNFEARVTSDDLGISVSSLSWTAVESTATSVKLLLRLEFPNGLIPRGSYDLIIAGSLAAPSDLPGTEWVSEFGYDPDGADMLRIEQNQLEFDGSRTLYLSRLFNALGQAHLARVGNTPLGVVIIELSVFA